MGRNQLDESQEEYNPEWAIHVIACNHMPFPKIVGLITFANRRYEVEEGCTTRRRTASLPASDHSDDTLQSSKGQLSTTEDETFWDK